MTDRGGSSPVSPQAEHYTTRDVARILNLPQDRVRRYARASFLGPPRGTRNEYLFSFQDLVLIRTAMELEASHVPPRRIHKALRELKGQLPADRPITAVRIAAEGDRVVVHDGATMWHPESGQVRFDFSVADLAASVAQLEPEGGGSRPDDSSRNANDWYELALEHETASPQQAQELYRRALEIDPRHADALVNLGCLLHEEERLEDARSHYRRALRANPRHATAAFNLGVVLEDLGRTKAALEAYLQAVTADPRMADAHYNLSRLCEATGDRAAALQHLRSYRDLTKTS